MVIFFQKAGHGTKHAEGLFVIGLLHQNVFKAAGQGRILFKILHIFPVGGGGDAAEFAPGQGGLDKVSGIVLSGGAAGSDEGVGLIDKEDNGNVGGFYFFNDLL